MILTATYIPLRTISIFFVSGCLCSITITIQKSYTLVLACKEELATCEEKTLQAQGLLKNSIKPEINTRQLNLKRKWMWESEEIQYFYPVILLFFVNYLNKAFFDFSVLKSCLLKVTFNIVSPLLHQLNVLL